MDLRQKNPEAEEAASFRAMADGIPFIIWLQGPNGEQEFVNRAFCEFFGVTRESMAGDRWQMLLHPDDKDAYVGEFRACIRDRRPFHAKARVKRADGEWRWIESHGNPQFSETGEFLGIVGTSPDITDRERAEARLKADLNALTRIQELSGEILGVQSLEQLLQKIMDAAVAIVGAGRGTLQLIEGDSLRIVASNEHRQPFLDFFASAEDRSSACGQAKAQLERVIIPDVEESPLFVGTPSLTVMREAGVRAVQSTPLVSRTGMLLGVLTTQWSVPYTPDKHDLWRIDLLARQAADLIEHTRTACFLRTTAQFPQQNPNPVLRVDTSGQLLFTNSAARAWLTTFGWTPGNPLPAALDAVAADAGQQPVEGEVTSPGGRVYMVTAVRPDGERYVNLYGTEITDRKHAENALRESEERFRTLVSTSSEILYRMSPDWSEMRQLYSRGLQTNTERPNRDWLQEYISPEDQPRVISVIHEAIRTKSIFELEHRVQRADGCSGWVLSRAVPLVDVSGEIVEWFGAATNITRRKEAEESTIRQNKVITGIARIFQEALSCQTEEELCIVCLSVAEELTHSSFGFIGEINRETGKLDDLAISDPGWELCRMSDKSGDGRKTPIGFDIRGIYGRVLRDAKGFFTNEPALHPDSIGTPPGHPPVKAFLGMPLMNAGSVMGMVGLAKHQGGYSPVDLDMIASIAPAIVQALLKRRAEESLRQLNETLEQSVQERTAGLRAANLELEERARQLRMLTGELTMVEQRERKRLSKVLHDGLQQYLVAARLQVEGLITEVADRRLKQSASEVERLLSEAIKVSRSLAAELSPPILHDAGILAGLEWLSSWKFEKYGLKVQLIMEMDAPRLSEDVKVLLFESVRELLLNVVKHAGTRAARVHLSKVDDDRLRILVSDEGKGFDVERLSANAAVRGGFGLFTIRERIKLIGGEFEVDSSPGKGARFILTAPVGYSEPIAVLPCISSDQPFLPAAGAACSKPKGKIRILLTDDHAVMREGLARLLGQERDFEVIGEASDGREAVEKAAALNPDVILMDVSMPNLNGIEATRMIRRQHPGIRIIGLSLYSEDERAKAMLEAGAAYYMTKSGPAADLKAAIRASIDEKARRMDS